MIGHQVAMAPLTHPVVREVFVNNLPSLSLLGVECAGSGGCWEWRVLGVEGAGREVENHVQHAHLHHQRCAPVLRVGIG